MKQTLSDDDRTRLDRLIADVEKRILMGVFLFGLIGFFSVIGILTPGLGWVLYFFLIPFWATFPLMILGSREGQGADQASRKRNESDRTNILLSERGC